MGKEGLQRSINRLAKQRRQTLQKILDTKDKMGLSKEGTRQLMRFLEKAPKTERMSMADLEPSAAKVLEHILEKEFHELPALFDARKLCKGPDMNNAGEGEKKIGLGDDGGKEAGWAKERVTEEGEAVEDEDEEEDDGDNDDDDDDDEGGYMTPIPVSP